MHNKCNARHNIILFFVLTLLWSSIYHLKRSLPSLWITSKIQKK